MSDDPSFGYKRPPVHTRFVAGRSGNPKGRPKGTRNLESDLREELAEQIPIREGERSLRVSKQRALLKALLAKALKGDTRAAAIVLQLVARVIAPEEADTASPGDEVTGDDLAILERFLARRNATRT